MSDKTENEKLAEEILVQRKPSQESYDKDEVQKFAEEYKSFIGDNKIEREIISEIKERAERAGFENIKEVSEIEKDGKYYREDRNRNIALIKIGSLENIYAVASHADSPCLHLKPYPLVENAKLALFKGHYYGGVKKYQWMNIPLSLRGVAFTEEGKKIKLKLGEEEDEPCFTIPDLLPHLAKEQLEKEGKKVVEGEQLNPIVGNLAIDDEKIEQKVKFGVAKILHEKYSLKEEDLVSAELAFVPAGSPRDVGFDESMIAGYGHDDRSSVFTSMEAILDSSDSDHTQICLFYDKEEIGSDGTTGAKNQFFTSIIEDLIDLTGSDLRSTQVWENTKVISADVTSAMDPNFPDAYDESNSSFIGHGVSVEKFGGRRGKYSSNDATAEFTHQITQLLKEEDVPWQTGEIGKIDLGGGGTIAKFLAKNGADVIDMGVPVLGMHAPFELASKADLYSAYNAYKAFLEKGFSL